MEKTGLGTVLFVDDEEINRILAQDILESLGYNVLTAIDGYDSLDIYREKLNEINLIIIDFMMPGINGKETFIKLREINPNCKIILASGYLGNDDIVEMEKLGLSGEIHKPYRIKELKDLLNVVLNI